MYARLELVSQIHKMCLNELHQLQSNVESYLQSIATISELLETNWEEVHQGNNLALIAYDSFSTSITNIMNSARKFNIQLHLNSLKTACYIDEMQLDKLNGNFKDNSKYDILKKVKPENIIPCSLESQNNLLPSKEFGESLNTEEEFIYPKLNLSDIYKSNTNIRALVTYINDIDSLKFNILDISSSVVRNILEISQSADLHQYHSRLAKSIPPVNEVFGLALDQRILRAVRCSKVVYDQKLDEEYWPCYLLEYGEVVRLKPDSITYKLTDEQKNAPALALFCQLKVEDNNPFLNHKKFLQDKLEKLLYQNCELRVVSIEENTLQVQIIEEPVSNENTNEDQSKITNSNNAQVETNPFKKSFEDNQHKLTEGQFEMVCDESLNNGKSMKSVTDYDSQDDNRICSFYNKSTEACFEGSNCKEEHMPLQSDGWTKDVVPAVFIIDKRCSSVIYPKGTIINITPTYIGGLERFYAQINDSHQHTTPLIWNDVPNWKLLEKPPHIFELVLSRYDDGLWYRAKIVAHDNDYKMFNVLYVDYGNHQIVDLRNLAKIDYSTAQIPFQAVLCRFAGAKENATIEPAERKKGIKMLCDFLLNKSVDVKVVYHYEDLIVSLVNNKKIPIPHILIQMGYMKPYMF